MLRRVDINVANNTPVIHELGNGRTPKNYEGTAVHLKHFGRKSKNDAREKAVEECEKTGRTILNGRKAKEEQKKQAEGLSVSEKVLRMMGDRDPEMRFTYLPLKDKYEGTFARELRLEEFVMLEDDCPNTGQTHAEQFDIIGDFENEKLLDVVGLS